MCLFDASSDALSAAVAMQQAAADLARSRRLTLQIRMGLSVGDVTLEEGDCFGMPVVEAARLEASADPGTILCTAVVRVMARGRGDHDLVPLGPRALKGIDEPVDVFEVRWESPDDVADPSRQTPFVGRDLEVERIRDRWESARTGQGGSVLISAEAGMGKSRLVSEFVESLDDATHLLVGTCHDGDSAPYAPVADALVSWAAANPDRANAMFGPQAAVLTTMAPGLADVVPSPGEPDPVAPELVNKRLLDSCERFLLRTASTEPTVLVLDDLHWAEQGTIGLLRVAARVAVQAPLLVVAAYRGAEIIDGHPLAEAMGTLLRDGAPTIVELDGLDAADVRALLSELGSGSQVDERFVDLLANESGGNPLFIREALLHLVSEGKLRREGDTWVSDGVETLELPDVLRHVITRRLDGLSDGAHDLLIVAALFDAGFPLAVVQTVTGVHDEAALDAIDEALGAGLIEPTDVFDTYRFSHAMFRQALVGGINPSRRARYHRRVAEALAEQADPAASDSSAAVIAQHFAASSDLPGAEAGVPFALAHGDTATAAGAHLDALDAYRMARSLLPEGDERTPDVQRSVAEASVLGRADPDSIISEATLFAAASTDRADAVDFLVGLGRLREAEDVLTAWRLGELARPLHSGERDHGWVSLRSWELAERDWRDPAATGLPTRGPERQELMDVGTRLHSPALHIANFLPRDVQEALDVAQWLPPLHSGLAYGFAAGRLREAIEPLTFAYDSALDVGDTGVALFALSALGRVRFTLGDFDESERLIEEGEAFVSKLGDFSNPVMQYGGLVYLTGEQRDPSGREAGQMDTVFEALSPDLAWMQVISGMAQITENADEGELEVAGRQFDEFVDLVSDASVGTPNMPYILCGLAELADVHGIEPTLLLARLIESHVIEPGFGYPEVDPEQALGILAGFVADHECAVEMFRRSRDTLDENGNVVVRALTPHYEARMEYRMGFPGGSDRFDELVAEARSLLGALRGFEPRMALLDELVAARDAGRPLPLD